MVNPKRLTREMYPLPDLSNKIRLDIPDAFGVVSDTHLGSRMEAVKELESIYDDFAERGIRAVFHIGDLCDGENVYTGHMRYVRCHGFEAQKAWAVHKYPRRADITTYIIAGNHDASFLIRSNADIINSVCLEREDLKNCGLFYARFYNEKIRLDVLHPRGGTYYSKSYGIQKWVRNNEMPSTYPDVMFFGHWHQHGYFNEHGIEAVMAGNFQHPNEYHIRMGYIGNIGGYIIEILKKDRPLRIRIEWISKEKGY